MTTKVKKLAVQPAAPAPAERPFVATNWVDAVADLSDRMLRVVGHQQSIIAKLTAELADARGVAAAAGRAHAELTTRIDDLVNLVEKLTTATDGQAEKVANIDAGLKLVDEAVGAHSQDITKLSKRIDDTVERVGAVEAVANGHAQSLTDQREALATVTGFVKNHGEVLVTMTGVTRDHGEALVAARAAIAEHDDRLVDLRGVVSAAGAAAAVQVERVDELGKRAGATWTQVEAVTAALDAETAARAAAVQAVSDLVEDYAKTASGEDGALSDRIDTVIQRFAPDAVHLEAAVERVGAVEVRVMELQRIAMENVERIDADSVRIERVDEAVTSFSAKVKAVAGEIEAIDARVKAGTASIEQTTAETADMLRRVNILLGELPSAMMIDQDGELVRVARSGEVTKLGNVISHGRDGTNAADIVAVRLDGERMVFTRSDRTEFGCSIAALIPPVAVAPAPPAPEIDPTALGYLSKDPTVRVVQVRNMAVMREAKKSYKLIADKYQISPRQVVRLIKGANDEK